MLAAAIALVVVRLAVNDWDPTRFVVAAPPAADPERVPEGFHVRTAEQGGFDGQFFYRLARDPFTRARVDEGIALDDPPYRQQRIGYPAIAWLLSGGRSGAVPWSLIGVNLAAAATLGGLARTLVRSRGHPAWAFTIALLPAGAVALSRDTAELLAATFVAAALLALRRERLALAAVAFAAAALTRESTLLFPAGVALAAGLGALRQRRLPPLATISVAAVPVAAAVAWQLQLAQVWGRLPVRSGEAALGLPFAGFVEIVARHLRNLDPEKVFDLGGMLLVVAFLVVAAQAARRGPAPAHEKVSFVVAALLVVLFRDVQWDGHTGYLRGAMEANLAGSLLLLERSTRADKVALCGVPLLWAAVGAVNALWL